MSIRKSQSNSKTNFTNPKKRKKYIKRNLDLSKNKEVINVKVRDLTRKALHNLAKELDLHNYSQLKISDLIKYISPTGDPDYEIEINLNIYPDAIKPSVRHFYLSSKEIEFVEQQIKKLKTMTRKEIIRTYL